jgi:DNA-binding beta-propeller fold protein YncE
MRQRKCNLLPILLLVTTLGFSATLKSVLTIDLPGPAGKRFDYLTIDYDDHYLLSAHLAAGLLYVIDLRTNQVVKAIPDVPGVEGVEFVPEMRKVYTSDAGDNTIGVIDLKQMKSHQKAAYRGQAGWQCLCRAVS